jgi:acyl dehydratase
MRTITGHEELKAAEGETLGTSEWREVTQDDVNAFADVTGDHQFIHVDVERAKETPFGGTIVHGYFTLALVPVITNEVVEFTGFNFALNYGANKIRFPSPLPTGSKIRGTLVLKEVESGDAGSQAILQTTVEREGGDKPVCVAETVVRFA